MDLIRVNNGSCTLSSIYQGACSGAVEGAVTGVTCFSAILAIGKLHEVLERTNRAIGNDPKWPLLTGDCEIEPFRNLSLCSNPPLFDSLTSLVTTVFFATTVGGMAIGAVSGAVKSAFVRSPAK